MAVSKDFAKKVSACEEVKAMLVKCGPVTASLEPSTQCIRNLCTTKEK